MAEARALYEESVRARPENLPDPLRLGAHGGDRPQFRARRRTARRGRKAFARQPQRQAAARRAARPRQGLRQGARRRSTKSSADAAAAAGAGGMEREGPAARQDGAARRGLRRLHRGQAHAARNHRPKPISPTQAAALVAAAGRLLHRRAPANPAARRRARRRRAADLHRRLSALGHHDDRADLDRPSADRRRRRTAGHQRTDRR